MTHRSAVEVYLHWIIRWRLSVVLAVLLSAGACTYGLRYLDFNTSYQVFFSKANPQFKAFQAFRNVYSRSDKILFVLAPADGRVFTPGVLDTVERLTERAWQIPYATRVDSITNFQHSYGHDDALVVEDLVRDALGKRPEEINAIQQIALNEPLLLNRLISPQGHVTGVSVTLQLPGRHSHEVQESVSEARGLSRWVEEASHGITVHLTGGAIMDVSFPEASLHDIRTLIPIVYLAVVLTIGLLLRSFWGTLATVGVIALSASSGMGLAGWIGLSLTPPSVGAVTIITTLAVADSIHILTTFFREMGKGVAKNRALLESLRLNLQPVFLTSLTTAIGFLSMNFSDAPPFRDLGNITAMGIGAAFVYSVSLLPAMMAALPVTAGSVGRRHARAMDRIAEGVIAHRQKLLWGIGFLVLVLGGFITRIELDDRFVEYFDPSVPFRKDTDFASANLTGIQQIEYSLDSHEEGGISDPSYLQLVERFSQWYARQPEVLHVSSFTQIMKRLNMNMHAEDRSWYRLPEERALAAQYLLLYQMSLPFGLDLNDQINLDQSATRLTVTLKNVSTRRLRLLEDRAQSWLGEHGPTLQTQGTSPSIMFAYISQRNIETMMVGTLLAFALIALTLSVAFGSVRMGLISLIPNLIPAVMAFGLWGWLVGRIGLVVSVVSAMTLGIIVDDTVHFLSKYLRGRREEGLDPAGAVRYAFATVGSALWFTSLILVIGFLFLTQSDFALNADTGKLTAITILFALLADFFFLPPLLISLEGFLKIRRGDGLPPPVRSG